MKKIVMILVACILLFSSCSTNSTKDAIPQKEYEFSENEINALLETAELLSEVIAINTVGFPKNFEERFVELSYPSAEDGNSINQFLYIFTYYQSKGYDQSIYAKHVYIDDNKIYHFSEEGILLLLSETFGIINADLTTSNFIYNPITKDYATSLEFGAGRGGWRCSEILGSEINTTEGTIIVKLKVENMFPHASGKIDEITTLLCENNFEIYIKEDGKSYVSFVGTKIIL